MSDKPDERKALASKSFDEWMDTLPDIDQRAFQSRRSYMAGYAAALAAPAEPDAKRYRFLRDQCDMSWAPAKSTANKLPAAIVDEAIDAAIEATEEPK